MRILTLITGSLLCLLPVSAKALPLEQLQLPDGYSISVAARVDNARQMTLGAEGWLYVGSRREGKVYRLRDQDNDGIYEQQETLMRRLKMPTGVVWHNGDLYVAAVNRILRVAGVDQLKRESLPVRGQLITDDLPDATHHGWKYLKFGPDGQLYFNLGAPCNTCLSDDPRFASLMRLNLKTLQQEVIAEGVRNSVGFTWHPQDQSLWFTDNGRDHLGDDLPADELNRLTDTGGHYGYPFVHGGDLPDPDFYEGQPLAQFIKPELKLGAHVAPLGLTFYEGQQLPDIDHNDLFIAEHGSWNRSSKVGYRVIRVDTDSRPLQAKPFITGWLQGESAWGRPVDVLTDRDGSLLISDDKAGAIYRVSYNQQ